MKQLALALLSICLIGPFVVHAQKWSSQWVKVDRKGTLTYVPDAKGNVIPDFSEVGYNKGVGVLPIVPVLKVVEPSENNSQEIIQSAIDSIALLPLNKNGFRGAVLLKKGTYRIPGTIKISASGIVLRGEGAETKLVATGKGQRSLIFAAGKGSLKEEEHTRRKITNAYVPVGAKSFSIASTEGLKEGDRIVVFRPGTQQWIHDLKMDQINQRDSTIKQWQPEEYDLYFERTITRIQGKTISIDYPVVMAMEEPYGGGAIFKYSFDGRITNVGVEYLTCESEYNGDEDEDHGWNAVQFNRMEDGWVRNVTAHYFGYSCVNLGAQSRNITVDSCQYLQPKSQITGGRRYSFNNDGQLNLVKNCFASEGRHDYVTGAKVSGPNVFYNCRSEKAKADIGPHHRWAVGTLFDNIITDGEINVQDRGDWGTGHGWAGVNQVIWNCTTEKAAIQSPWVSGKNYVIGLKGKKYEGRLKGRPDGEWEGQNRRGLVPTSLYATQVQQRVL